MNLNIFKTFWLVLAITAGLSLTNTATAQQYALDLDGDGNVDFADFIFFTEHFGKAMFDQPLAEVVTVRDTVIITNEQDQTAGVKLGQIFGYWLVDYEIPHERSALVKKRKDAFLFHHTNGSDKNTVYGKSINHGTESTFAHPEKEAKVTYLPFEDQYILIHKEHIGFSVLENNTSEPKTGVLHDLEIKFSIEHEIRDDMTKLLNNIPNLPPEWYKTISEPVVKIEYMRVFVSIENRYVYLNPVNSGLRPCSRDEYIRLFEKP